MLPRGYGVTPTDNNIARFQAARETYLVAEKDRIASARKDAEKLAEITLSLTMKANDAGHLFGSVTEQMISDAIAEAAQVKVPSSSVIMGAHLKHVGDHVVALHLHSEVEVEMSVVVHPEEAKPEAVVEAEAPEGDQAEEAASEEGDEESASEEDDAPETNES